jgi:spore coat protein CotF
VKPTIAQSPVVKESTEQTLANTVDHAREVTKSQVSGSRQHAQKAEDEMSDMLKNK